MLKGKGVTRQVIISLNVFKKKVISYHELYKDDRILDLSEDEHVQFCHEANLFYGDLTSEERSMCNEVKDNWEFVSQHKRI